MGTYIVEGWNIKNGMGTITVKKKNVLIHINTLSPKPDPNVNLNGLRVRIQDRQIDLKHPDGARVIGKAEFLEGEFDVVNASKWLVDNYGFVGRKIVRLFYSIVDNLDESPGSAWIRRSTPIEWIAYKLTITSSSFLVGEVLERSDDLVYLSGFYTYAVVDLDKPRILYVAVRPIDQPNPSDPQFGNPEWEQWDNAPETFWDSILPTREEADELIVVKMIPPNRPLEIRKTEWNTRSEARLILGPEFGQFKIDQPGNIESLTVRLLVDLGIGKLPVIIKHVDNPGVSISIYSAGNERLASFNVLPSLVGL